MKWVKVQDEYENINNNVKKNMKIEQKFATTKKKIKMTIDKCLY